MRMGVEATIHCAFELVYPDGEVELFVVWREQADFNFLAVLDLRSSPVVGVLIAFILC